MFIKAEVYLSRDLTPTFVRPSGEEEEEEVEVEEPRPPRVKIHEIDPEEGLDDPAKLWLAIEDAGFKDTVHVGIDWLTAEDLYFQLGHFLQNKDVL